MKLWNLLSDGLSHIGLLQYGRATSGSTTTVVDTNRPEEDEAEDFEDGTLIILRDAGGASAAPEGEFSRITEYAPGTNTFTTADTLTAAVASGDRYGVTSNLIHHDELIELAYQALVQLGDLSYENTSLTSATDQTEYTLPTALKEYKTLAIYYQGKTDDANDNQWIAIDDWETGFSAAGSTATLYLHQLPDSKTIRIVYWGQHPKLNEFSDAISEYVHPVLARASFVERIANRLVGTTQHSVPSTRIGYDKAAQEFQEALNRYPIHKHKRHAKLMIVDGYLG